MGLFDGRSQSYSGRTSHSPSRHSTTGHGHYTRPTYARSGSSVFGGSVSRGFGGGFGGSSGSSYYKRRPRDGYIQYLMHKLQRMVKELWSYGKRHPVKAFFAVVVPLISAGGAIHSLLRQFGIRMPMGLDGSMGKSGGGYYGSSGYSSSSQGWMGNAGSLFQIAKTFM